MTAFLAAFDLYYFCFCAVVGGVASGITVSGGQRKRAVGVGTLVGAALYVIQLPVWLSVIGLDPAVYSP
ncbi:MAG: hypothetical protein AAFQ36_03135 [Pseudomonadota bacterium]